MSDFLDSNDIMQNGFGIMPKMVMKSKSISIEAKAIYAYIVSYAGAGKTAFPSVDLICYDLNISRKRFYSHREQLIEAGLIEVTKNRNSSGFDNNVYRLVNSVCSRFVTEHSVTEQIVDERIVDKQDDYANNNNSTNNSIKSNKDKNKESKSPDNFNAKQYLSENLVSEDLINDFILHRKNKRALITKRVIDQIISQSAIAGYSLEQAIETLIERGWNTFKADWVKDKIAAGGYNPNKQEALEERNKKVLEEYLAKRGLN